MQEVETHGVTVPTAQTTGKLESLDTNQQPKIFSKKEENLCNKQET